MVGGEGEARVIVAIVVMTAGVAVGVAAVDEGGDRFCGS
jgi:hypothetical protein